jgi:hypothetical protein
VAWYPARDKAASAGTCVRSGGNIKKTPDKFLFHPPLETSRTSSQPTFWVHNALRQVWDLYRKSPVLFSRGDRPLQWKLACCRGGWPLCRAQLPLEKGLRGQSPSRLPAVDDPETEVPLRLGSASKILKMMCPRSASNPGRTILGSARRSGFYC